MKNNAVEVGDTFGMLTVSAHLEPRDGDARVRVRCLCGEYRPCFVYNLKNGNTKSCGCARRVGATPEAAASRVEAAKLAAAEHQMALIRATRREATKLKTLGKAKEMLARTEKKLADLPEDVEYIKRHNLTEERDNRKGRVLLLSLEHDERMAQIARRKEKLAAALANVKLLAEHQATMEKSPNDP